MAGREMEIQLLLKDKGKTMSDIFGEIAKKELENMRKATEVMQILEDL